MNKTLGAALIVGLIIVLAMGIFLFGAMYARSHWRGPLGPGGSGVPNANAGGLVAITADGNTISSDADGLPANTASQKVGDLNVTLALSPYPPMGWQPGTFDVTLTDQSGQPVTDARVSLDLTMPGMWMPPNSLQAQSAGSEAFHADGRFTMRGLWRIEVIVERAGHKESAYFGVWL